MVQDMHGPEYYVEKYKTLDSNGETQIVSGKYKELIEVKVCIIFLLVEFERTGVLLYYLRPNRGSAKYHRV